MASPMVTRAELEAETRAYNDAGRRMARNDPDWRVYFDGKVPPKLPWWRRLLKL